MPTKKRVIAEAAKPVNDAAPATGPDDAAEISQELQDLENEIMQEEADQAADSN